MSIEDVPGEVAQDLVELLFDDGTPSSTDTLLLVNPTPSVVDSLEAYYSAEITASAPRTTGIHSPDVGPIDFDWDSIGGEVLEADFLRLREDVGDGFDYVLCVPSDVNLGGLTTEERKGLATNFASFSIETEVPNSSALHLEQVLKYLSSKGRGTLLAGPEFKASEDFDMLGNQLSFSIDHIDVYDSEETSGISGPRAATLVTNRGYEAEHTGFSYNPEYFESLLGQHVEVERPFQVAAVMTDDPIGYGKDETGWKTYFDLHYRDFDAALVFENPEIREGLIGYVSRQRLRSREGEKLSEKSQNLDEQVLLEPDAGTKNLIEALSTNRFQFVGSEDHIEGVVTRFDLNRLPVFLHLYDCFSEFEIGLRNLIREQLPDWEEETSVYIGTTGSDELYSDKLASASLKNLVEIVEEAGLATEIRRDIHGYEETLGDLVALRNMVAHYNPIIHTMGGADEHSDERDAAQLWSEYQLLTDAIEGLQSR